MRAAHEILTVPISVDHVLHSLVVVTIVSGLHGPGPVSLTALTRYLYCISGPSPVNS